MNTVILSFKPDGTARAVWTDDFPLAALGSCGVDRASTVEFNAAAQVWEVRLGQCPPPEAPVVFRDASRAKCIAWEIAQLQEAL